MSPAANGPGVVSSVDPQVATAVGPALANFGMSAAGGVDSLYLASVNDAGQVIYQKIPRETRENPNF